MSNFDEVWDAIVVGAGPAGAVTAGLLAATGLETLLVEKHRFPRKKVCGGCLNGNAMRTLESIGLARIPEMVAGEPLRQFRLATSGEHADLNLDGGMAVERSAFDAALVAAAQQRGVVFQDGVTAAIGEVKDSYRLIELKGRSQQRKIGGKVVVVATGLHDPPSNDNSLISSRVATSSRYGAALMTSHFPNSYEPGIIYMAVGPQGYVGLTRLGRGELNIATAIEKHCLKSGSLASACEGILRQSGLEVSTEMLSGQWLGTTALTRSRTQHGSERLLFIGDAAGYVEPFTGEGMAWAISDAVAVSRLVESRLVEQGLETWPSELHRRWEKTARGRLRRRQRFCRLIAAGLRSPVLTTWTRRLLQAFPMAAHPFTYRLNHATQ